VATGYFGSLFGMFLVLPFVSASVRAKLPAFLASACDALSVKSVAGVGGFVRVNAYLPTAAVWLLAAVPILFLARLPRAVRKPSGRSPFADVMATVKSLPATPAILWFLVSNLLYVDVVHTIQIQISTYSKFAAGLSDPEVQVFLLVCTAVAILGGFLYGALCQRVTIRTAILVTFANWLAAFVLALAVRGAHGFWAVGLLAGLGLGGVKVTSKLGLIALVPRERLGEFFGFFTLAGEAASVVGPFLWAATLALFPDRSPAGYRAALAVLLAVLVAAALTFLKVRFPAREAEAA
jgi:UMF1 family MFS transporter